MADAVDVKEYYEQHTDKEREYARVYSAIPIKEGEHWTATVFGGLKAQQSADEDGYKIKAYTGMHDCEERVMSTEEFAEKMMDAAKLHPSEPPADLDDDDLKAITPIKKGKQFIAMGIISARAECDGFLYKGKDGNDTFLSNYSVASAFNYAGKKEQTDGSLIVRAKDEPMLKGIILDEDVTFNFKSGPYEAKKGSFVTPNPDDEDGFIAFPPGFATFGLRRNQTDEEIAAISNVKLDNAVGVKGPLHFKKQP
jgi:hypothetical protein